MEKLSSAPRRLVLGGLVLGAVIAAALVLQLSREDAAPAQAPKTAKAAEPAKPAAAPSAATPSDTTDPLAPPVLMPDEIMALILKKDEKLGRFMDLHKRVLLDGPNRDEYRKMLADTELMNAFAETLMDPGKGTAEPEEQYHRLMLHDYFEAAMTWGDNPHRADAVATTGKIVSHDNFSSEQPKDRREMLAGGKMELFRMMYESDPAKADALVAQAKGTRMEALTTWMSEENQRRIKKEEDIRKEMASLQTQEAAKK
jgi:hypothetical protein